MNRVDTIRQQSHSVDYTKRTRGMKLGGGLLPLVAIVSVFSSTLHATRSEIIESLRNPAKQHQLERARMSEEVSARASGRGNPWINLSDGHELITPYSGPAELTSVLEKNEARALSLCSADLDEDGVPDLIGGFGGPNGGIVTLLRGNVDSIYPNAPEAQHRRAEGTFTDAPFLSPAFVFGAREAADFIGAGDFDGDGHWDVVTAARGSDKLNLMPGDGKGGLRETKQIELPGGVTAMVAGEINRRDGLDDVVVGVSGESGAKLLVFEGPGGALRANPELFDLPAAAASLALGQLDDSYEMDLAIAAGRQLMILHGRDRRLSLDKERQAQVIPACVEQREFPFMITSIGLGDFSGRGDGAIAVLGDDGELRVLSSARMEEAKAAGKVSRIQKWKSRVVASGGWSKGAKLFTARMSSTPVDNVLVTDPDNHTIASIAAAPDREATQSSGVAEQLLEARFEVATEPEAVLPMRLNGDALSDLVILARGRIPPTAMMTAAALTFSVTNTNDSGPGSFRQAIADANSNSGVDLIRFDLPGGVGTIRLFSQLPDVTEAVTIDGVMSSGNRVELDGTSAGPNSAGLQIFAGNSRVRGLVINRFTNSGIVLDRNGNNLIDSNFIGTDSSGTLARGNFGNGINLIGGSNNLIGGTTGVAANLVSANAFPGIAIGGTNVSQNLVQGNFVGVDIRGTAALPNDGAGVLLGGVSGTNNTVASNNTVGGAAAGAGNLISGNDGSGVEVNNKDSNGNLVQRNFVGTDISGTVALANTGAGVQIKNGSLNIVGGTTAGAVNLISGNTGIGVFVGEIGATENRIQGNFIGTDSTGTRRLGNSNGVRIDIAFRNTIGGVVPGSGNLISGNRFPGVALSGSGGTENQIQGNFIGTDLTGTLPLGNAEGGVLLGGFLVDQNSTPVIARKNTIGGTTAGSVNLISGNDGPGVLIVNFGCTENLIQGNAIGTDISGTRAVPNQGSGVFITQAPDNTIGPINLISGNRDHGISIGIRKELDGGIVTGGTGITVRGNFIGTNLNGTGPLGNGLNGVFVDADSISNTIDDNLIAFNGRNGICIPNNNNPGLKIRMTANRIFSNAAIGIDLGLPGVTQNDDRDLDLGANTLQNFPVANVTSTFLSNRTIAGVVTPTAITTIRGVFNSTPNQTFTLEFFFGRNVDASGHQFVGSIPIALRPTVQVTTDSNGNASFEYTFEIPGGANGGFVNSTATDPTGNTSELSTSIVVSGSAGGGPVITGACRGDGKQLMVNGFRFVEGAKVFLNGEQEKTSFVSSTQVIAKKAGKRAQTGDTLKVRNPDGSETTVLVYTRNNCSP